MTVDNVLVINSDLRTIAIPEGVKHLGVEGDDGVLRLKFSMPRTYSGFDLSEFDIRINYVNANGDGDVYYVEDAETIGDTIEFGWLVGRYAFVKEGDVEFNVCLKKVRGTGSSAVVEKEFNTKPTKLPVDRGLETTEKIEQMFPDVLEKWRENLLGRFDGQVDETLTKSGNAADAAVTGSKLGILSSNINGKASKSEVAVERARIDNMIKTKSTVSDDVELFDMRVDVDGSTHDTAGNAVRNQILDLRKNVINPNLIDFNTLRDGYLDAYGAPTGGSSPHFCYYTDYIEIDSSLPYYWYIEHSLTYGNDPWVGFCTYDVNRNFIERLSWYVNERAIKFDSEVKYIRISYRSLMLGRPKFEQSTYRTAFEEIISENIAETYPICIPGYVNPSGGTNTPTADGYVGVNGLVMNECMSRHVLVRAGDTYVFYNGVTDYPWAAVGFYGSDGKIIERVTINTDERDITEVVVPDGAVAMRYCARKYSQHTFICYKKTGYNNYMDEYIKLVIASMSTSTKAAYCVKSIAHRGFCSGAPENTLSAYRLAARKGFEYAECDVAFTSDNVPVLLHDGTIDRTSNGTGNINNLTFEEVRAYDFGSWYNAKYTGERIPSFAEFIALCKKLAIHPYIEIKSSATYTRDQINMIVNIVKQYGMRGKVTYISFEPSYLEYVKDCDPDARLGYVVNTVTDDVIETASGLMTGTNEVFIDSASGATTHDMINLCINANIPLEMWTVNDRNWLLNSMHLYVSGVTSDGIHAGITFYEANN